MCWRNFLLSLIKERDIKPTSSYLLQSPVALWMESSAEF
jgi:hypothetical protein